MAAAVGFQPPALVPSYMRSLPGSVNIPVAEFPSAVKAPAPIEPASVAAQLVQTFNQSLDAADFTSLSKLFVADGYWRDHLALSWQFRTVQTPSRIAEFLKTCGDSKDGFRLRKVAIDDSSDVRAPKTVPIDTSGDVSGVQFFVNLETTLGTGVGLMRLVEDAGGWKIHTLYTRLEELRGYEQPLNARRAKGVEHGGKPGRENWSDRRKAATNFSNGREPAVVILGESPFQLLKPTCWCPTNPH